MRYFLATRDGVTVGKHAFGGDLSKADELVAEYRLSHPGQIVEEVSQQEFEAAGCRPELTPTQQAWIVFKATTPTPGQAIQWLAKYLGLE